MKNKSALSVLLIIASIVATIVLLNVFIAVVYRPIGPALTVDSFFKGCMIERQLEQQYADDDFKLVNFAVDREDLFNGFQPYGYSYEFKSKLCGDETVHAFNDFELKNTEDNYLSIRYKNDANPLIEKSLDAYFGDGHYNYCVVNLNDYVYCDTFGTKKPDLYYYIGQLYLCINITVDSSFSTDNQEEIENAVKDSLYQTFDIGKSCIDIYILFDKDDDVDIPDVKEIDTSSFYNYKNLNYWAKSLTVANETNSDYETFSSVLNTEWKNNDEENFSFNTTNEFLNGAKVYAVINGYEFSPDGSITFKELLDNTGCVNINCIVEPVNFNPDDSTEQEIAHKDKAGTFGKIGVVNKTNGNTKVENGSVYSVGIGQTFTVETETYKDCSVCGLKIGDTPTEDELVNMFGPYEEKKTLNDGDISYDFVDGTVTGYATGNHYSRHFRVVIQDGAIRYLYCSYYEPDNNYKYYYDN